MTAPGGIPYIVVVGSANVDTVVNVVRFPEPGQTVTAHSLQINGGGKGLNQAVAAARAGASVRFVGAVGDDAGGEFLAGLLRADGVELSSLARVAGVATGSALVTVDDQGANTVVVSPGANHRLGPDRLDTGSWGSPAVVLVQQEIPAATVLAALRAGRELGARTILNPAPAPGELAASTLALVDVLVPNETELAVLVPGFDGGAPRPQALEMVKRGAASVVVTLGAKGALVVDGGGGQRVAPFPVVARDTTGAGDAFCGTLAVALAMGMPLVEAARRAAGAGALAATVAGAYPSLPTAAQVDQLVAPRAEGPL